LICMAGWFATKLFHPNVSSSGEICVNTLKKDWKSTYGIEHILVTVKCLLICPNPESALDEEAGKLLLENYSTYCDRAKLITSVHATPRVRPAEFDIPAAAQASSSTDASSSVTPPSTTPSKPTNKASPLLPPLSQFTLPIVTRKSASPAPPSPAMKLTEKGGIGLMNKDRERYASPSPLGPADANVGGKASTPVSMNVVLAAPATSTKAVKRAATGGGATNAEKRKKALKRL
jgi:ubiquitin-conjugating enzyme E2 S